MGDHIVEYAESNIRKLILNDIISLGRFLDNNTLVLYLRFKMGLQWYIYIYFLQSVNAA